MGVQVAFDSSVTATQQAWWQEAYSRTRFPLDMPTVPIKATVFCVDDPPATGHNDYMATVVEAVAGPGYPRDPAGVVKWYIRTGADDPNAPMNASVKDELDLFFMECVIHELGHGVQGALFGDDASIAEICPWFVYDIESPSATRATPDRGTAADFYQPTDGSGTRFPAALGWGDVIQEAYAEFFKDVYMPAEWRYYSNRSNWNFDRAHFDDFLDMLEGVICPPAPAPVILS